MSSHPHPQARRNLGLVLSLIASVTFGTSGVVARSLLDSGWSPLAAVVTRASGAALLLVPAAVVQLRGDFGRLRTSWRHLVLLGLFGVGGAQFCYFAAVDRMPVGIALLIEYQGPLLLILWTWARTRIAPPRLVLVGAALATIGLVLILDIRGGGLDPVGVAYACGAAVCVAFYFHLSGTPDPGRVPPIATSAAAMVVGAAALVVVGGAGILPMDFSTERADLFGVEVEWWWAAIAVVVLCTAIPYSTSIAAMGHLGARVGSFVSLLELLAAIVFAWIVVNETPTAVQGVGGLVMLAGIVCVQAGDVSSREPLELGHTAD